MKTTASLVLFFLSTICFSVTFTVLNTNDNGTGSLRAAIATAVSGNIIVFNTSLANQTITLLSTLEISANKNLIISRINAVNLTISGDNAVSNYLLRPT